MNYTDTDTVVFWGEIEGVPKKGECWKWNGETYEGSRIAKHYFAGRFRSAAWVAWWLTTGTRPYGKFVMNNCETLCVNPHHSLLADPPPNHHYAYTL